MNQDTYRSAVATGCVLGGIFLHYTGTINFVVGVVIWLLLAAGVGYMRPFGPMIAVAPIPWIIGVGGGVLTGRYDDLGELWLLPFAISTIAGVIGVIFGAAARRGGGRHRNQESE